MRLWREKNILCKILFHYLFPNCFFYCVVGAFHLNIFISVCGGYMHLRKAFWNIYMWVMNAKEIWLDAEISLILFMSQLCGKNRLTYEKILLCMHVVGSFAHPTRLNIWNLFRFSYFKYNIITRKEEGTFRMKMNHKGKDVRWR